MTVRRFLCPEPECPRRIFVEPLDGFAARHARTTTRLDRPPSRHRLGPGGRSRGKAGGEGRRADQPRYAAATRQAGGAADRRGPRGSSASTTGPGARGNATAPSSSTSRPATSSTSCRTATPRPSRPWLEAHPGIELVSRDRSSAYSQAATEAASEAQQVADRWHLLKNVREAVERLLERHLPVITEALKPAEADPERTADASARDELDAPTATEPTAVPNRTRNRRHLRLRPHRDGRPRWPGDSGASSGSSGPMSSGGEGRRSARSPETSACRGTRCAATSVASDCPDWRPGRATRSGMDAHREWIDARIAEGRINASELHGELASRGVRLSYATVRRYVTKRLGRAGKVRPRVNAAKPKPTPPPSPKRLSFDWVRRPEKRTAEAQARLDAIRAASPDLTTALDLADEFAALIRKRSTGTLKEWLSRAEVSPCPEIRNFAEGDPPRRIGGERGDHDAMEQRPGGRSREPSEDDQTTDVWPSGIRPLEGPRRARA